MINRIKGYICFFIFLSICIIPNVYANTLTPEQKLIEILPSELVIPFNDEFISNQENFILYNDNISRMIDSYLYADLEKKIIDNSVENVCRDGYGCSTYYYISNSEFGKGFNISFEHYYDYISGEKKYFTYYYQIYTNGKMSNSIPFKVFLDNKNEEYDKIKNIYDMINDKYEISIGQFYKLNSDHRFALDIIGLSEDNNFSYDIDIINYIMPNNNIFKIDDYYSFILAIKYKNHYYLNKMVKFKINNQIVLPDYINSVDETKNYIYNYLRPLFSNNEVIEVKYVDDTYLLNVNNTNYSIRVEQNVDDKFNSGIGTKENPYKISSPQELFNMRFAPNAYYELINDIDLTYETQNENGLFYNDGKGWLPICNDMDDNIYNYNIKFDGNKFNGTFEGNNHSIIGLKINRYDSYYNGLFGYIGHSGEVKNLKIIDADVQGSYSVGIVAGFSDGTLDNIQTSGNVSYNGSFNGGTYIGGVVGRNGGMINKVYNFADVISIINVEVNDVWCAGITPINSYYNFTKSSISNSINFGKVIAINKYKRDCSSCLGESSYASGIVWQNQGYISNVANFGEIYGNIVSGLINWNLGDVGIVYNAYNAGKVKLYKDFFIGTQEWKKANVVGATWDNSLYNLFGIMLYDDNELSNESSSAVCNEGNCENKILYTSSQITLDNAKNKLSIFDYANDWEYSNDNNFPLIKGMQIDIPIYNFNFNSVEVEVNEEELDSFTYQLDYNVDNLNFDYLFFNSSSSKVKIDSEGLVTLNLEDSDEYVETTITIRTILSNQSISKKISFKINRQKLSDMIIANNYKINNNLIYGFTYKEAISSILNKFKNKITINSNLSIIATGTEIIYKNEKYIAVVHGDPNGDGAITPLDYIRIKNHIMGDYIITGAEYIDAADANRDGAITPLDYIRIKNLIMNGEV